MISGKSTLKLIDVTTGIPEDTIKYGVAFHECIDADGNSYKVVKIGDQTWMDENLKTTKFNDGTAIPYTKDNSVWSASVLASTPAYCWYSDDTYQNAYGALYNWYAVNTGKLAPVGWHVATDDEWTILGNYLMANGYNYDGTTTSNKYAKSLATTYSRFGSIFSAGCIGDDLSKNNSAGFYALPGGYRDSGSGVYYLNQSAFWRSASENGTGGFGWNRSLLYYSAEMYRDSYVIPTGMSICCVKDLFICLIVQRLLLLFSCNQEK